MIFAFCRDGADPSQPERAFAREVAAVDALGAPRVLLDHDAAVAGDWDEALRGVVAREETPAVYRGWMLSAARYAELYRALAARGLRLITDPEAYRRCHHLPEAYPALVGHTPQTVWIPAAEGHGRDVLERHLAALPAGPAVLKDYVKSVKHDWDDACFVREVRDLAEVQRVVANFLGWQGASLEGGLCFRAFVELRALGAHPQSGMPLTEEYRALILDGRVLTAFPYWEAAAYPEADPPSVAWLEARAAGIQSPFFSLDAARTADGRWLAIEVGDGQVTGLPEPAAEAVLAALARR